MHSIFKSNARSLAFSILGFLSTALPHTALAFTMHAGTWRFSPNRYYDWPKPGTIEGGESIFCISGVHQRKLLGLHSIQNDVNLSVSGSMGNSCDPVCKNSIQKVHGQTATFKTECDNGMQKQSNTVTISLNSAGTAGTVEINSSFNRDSANAMPSTYKIWLDKKNVNYKTCIAGKALKDPMLGISDYQFFGDQ